MKVRDLIGKHLEVAMWAEEGFPTPGIAQKMGISESQAARLLDEVYAKVGVANRKELRSKYTSERWEHELFRIRRFVDRHGQSRMPVDYSDEDGRLGGVVLNIRWHAAGRGGASPGPFPGVEYGAPLDDLDGWSWDLEDSPGLKSGNPNEALGN